MRQSVRMTLLASVAAMSLPAFAHAQSAQGAQVLEEVIVTAERRTSDVQRTPASVSVRSGDDLAVEGRFTLRDVLEDVPGVAYSVNNVVQGGSDTQGTSVVIRGMSGNLSASGGASALSGIASTAVYVDGVYEGLGSQYDLERVEVLRGPQGTLYGRSATGGVVAFHTRDPSLDKFEADASAEFASYDLQHYSGALNIPLADSLAVRLSADLHDRGEGFFTGEGGARQKTSARVKVLFKPNDRLSVLVGAALEDNKSKFGALSLDASAMGVVTRTIVPLSDGENHSRQVWAEIDYDLGWANLTYQPALRKFEQDDSQFVSIFNGNELSQEIFTPYSRFMTHELRLASNTGDSRLNWQVGAFLYDNELQNSNVTHYTRGGLAFSSQTQKETSAWGVFGEGTYRLTDTTRLTLGARYDYTKVESPLNFTTNANFAGCNFGVPGCTGPGLPEVLLNLSLPASLAQEEFNNFNYKVRLEHDLTPQNLIFASVATGFLPGDVGVVEVGFGPFTTLEVNKVDAETLTAYEIGTKNRFFDNTLQLNAGLFFYDYGGFQTMYQAGPGTPTTVSVSVPAHNVGAEVEALWQFTSNDRLGLSYAYVESRYRNKPANFAAVITQKTQALVPHTLTVNYDHTFELPGGSSLRAGIDVRWESSSRSANIPIWDLAAYGPFAERDAQTIGNLSATWSSQDDRYQLGGYVRNFTDEDTILYTRISRTGVAVSYPDPRQYGVILSARF